jgi:predicted amidohydrolase YtcJ
VTSANPLEAIHVAVNRALPGAAGPDAEPFLPEQRLDLAHALAAYTAGSAYVNHLDSETGRVAPGFLADLAVLAADPFAERADDIASIGVEQTYVSGERVFGE